MHKFYFKLVGYYFCLSFNNKSFFKVFKEKYKHFLVKKNLKTLIIFSFNINTTNTKKCDFIKKNEKIQIDVSIDEAKPFNDLVLELNWIIKTIISSELSKYNFTLLHASGFYRNNSFYVFAGKSGAGKSTISKIAEENSYIKPCDDSVLIKEENGKFTVYSTPFIEKEKTYYKKSGWKLNSIFFLNQSFDDYKKKLSTTDSIKKIVLNTYLNEDVKKNEMLINSFSLSQKIAEQVPCYDLFFTKSNKFLKTILN